MIDSLVLAIALAMDATAVAAARAVTGMSRREALVLASSFGVFQAGMAAIGWALGHSAKALVERWDHWIAFGLLAAIGGKMLYEAFASSGEAERSPAALDLRTVVLLSIATSIDALAAGVTLPVLRVSPVVALIFIGVASLVLSLAGAFAGAAAGSRLGKRLEVLGGVTLIALGIKALVQHLAG